MGKKSSEASLRVEPTLHRSIPAALLQKNMLPVQCTVYSTSVGRCHASELGQVVAKKDKKRAANGSTLRSDA